MFKGTITVTANFCIKFIILKNLSNSIVLWESELVLNNRYDVSHVGREW